MDPFSAVSRPFQHPDFSLESRLERRSKSGGNQEGKTTTKTTNITTKASTNENTKNLGFGFELSEAPPPPSITWNVQQNGGVGNRRAFSSAASYGSIFNNKHFSGVGDSYHHLSPTRRTSSRQLPFLVDNDPKSEQDQIWQEKLNYCIVNSDGYIDLSERKLFQIPHGIDDLVHLTSIGSKRTSSSRSLTFTRNNSSKFNNNNNNNNNSNEDHRVPIELFLNGNYLSRPDSFPPTFFLLNNLRVLTLRNNGLTELSPLFGELSGLQELSIGGNQLKYLPAELDKLKLEKLHIFPNPFLLPPPTRTASTTDQTDHEQQECKCNLGPLEVSRQSSVPSLVEFCLRYLLAEEDEEDDDEEEEVEEDGEEGTRSESSDRTLVNPPPLDFADLSLNSSSSPSSTPSRRTISNTSLRFSSTTFSTGITPPRRINKYERFTSMPKHIHDKLWNRVPLWLCPGCSKLYFEVGAKRMEWKNKIANVDFGTQRIPCQWVACTKRCLNFLE